MKKFKNNVQNYQDKNIDFQEKVEIHIVMANGKKHSYWKLTMDDNFLIFSNTTVYNTTIVLVSC